MYAYEIAEDAPYMFPLSPCKCASPTQGLAFLHHKNILNVRKVEFARAYRYLVIIVAVGSIKLIWGNK